MSGLPLNGQLTDHGAKLVGPVKTAAVYRMYDLGPKPSLIRQQEGEDGYAFELELWELPIEAFGAFMQCALLHILMEMVAQAGTQHNPKHRLAWDKGRCLSGLSEGMRAARSADCTSARLCQFTQHQLSPEGHCA